MSKEALDYKKRIDDMETFFGKEYPCFKSDSSSSQGSSTRSSTSSSDSSYSYGGSLSIPGDSAPAYQSRPLTKEEIAAGEVQRKKQKRKEAREKVFAFMMLVLIFGVLVWVFQEREKEKTFARDNNERLQRSASSGQQGELVPIASIENAYRSQSSVRVPEKRLRESAYQSLSAEDQQRFSQVRSFYQQKYRKDIALLTFPEKEELAKRIHAAARQAKSASDRESYRIQSFIITEYFKKYAWQLRNWDEKSGLNYSQRGIN
jgi:hypothetical protein